MTICLASDNFAPVHPLVMEALLQANQGFAPAYGLDPWTKRATELIEQAVQAKCKTLFVPTGTGANVLALKIALLRHESCLCTDVAHLCYQEAGAAESIAGCKLLNVAHQGGKVSLEELAKKVARERAFGHHSTSPRLLSITQPTEFGTVYSVKELKALSQFCKEENLLLHIDGSRLYNALVHLDLSLSELVQISCVDLLSLGGTKNGLMGAEALLVFNPSLHASCDYLQKQTLQLLSKNRYVAAQYIPFFEQRLWHLLAQQANQKGQQIAQCIQETKGLSLSYPVQTNQIFFKAPQKWISSILETIRCFAWDLEAGEIRLVASWNTSEEEVAALNAFFQKLS